MNEAIAAALTEEIELSQRLSRAQSLAASAITSAVLIHRAAAPTKGVAGATQKFSLGDSAAEIAQAASEYVTAAMEAFDPSEWIGHGKSVEDVSSDDLIHAAEQYTYALIRQRTEELTK